MHASSFFLDFWNVCFLSSIYKKGKEVKENLSPFLVICKCVQYVFKVRKPYILINNTLAQILSHEVIHI